MKLKDNLLIGVFTEFAKESEFDWEELDNWYADIRIGNCYFALEDSFVSGRLICMNCKLDKNFDRSAIRIKSEDMAHPHFFEVITDFIQHHDGCLRRP